MLVAPGTYVKNIVLPTSPASITVRSSQGPAPTIINGNQAGSVVTFQRNSVSVLDGFTLTNGDGLNGGGGVAIGIASRIVRNNVIKNNVGDSGGGILIVAIASWG